jgi:hypothetical protein
MDAHGGGSIIPSLDASDSAEDMAHGPAAKGPGKGIRGRSVRPVGDTSVGTGRIYLSFARCLSSGLPLGFGTAALSSSRDSAILAAAWRLAWSGAFPCIPHRRA